MNSKKTFIEKMRSIARKFPRGEKNAITDIPGVKVGHFTINKDIQQNSNKKFFIRTGLTAVLPYPMEKEMRLFAGSVTLRGKNEMTGYEVTDDFCYLNSPIVITNSFNVGRAYNAILSYGFFLGRDEIWPPFVIGINDSLVNDMRRSLLNENEILNAFRNASETSVAEGSVGIGLGLKAFGWKGGIGTSSRKLIICNKQFTVGVLVATNCGNKRLFKKGKNTLSSKHDDTEGSLTLIVGVDIPVAPYQIRQISTSLVSNLAPLKTLKNCSDSITCVLFSTANSMSMKREENFIFDFQIIDDALLEKIALAGSEATNEAILHSLLKATPIKGKMGRKIETITDLEFKKLSKEFEGFALK